MEQNINNTRIIIYDLTGDSQVLKSYDNKHTFQQNNKFVDKSILSNNNTEKKDVGKILLNDNNNNKISTIDDVIQMLSTSNDYTNTSITKSNANSNNRLCQKEQCIVFNANKNFEQHEFFIKCDDRCYLKFKLPLIFDIKNKILYHPHTNQKITAGFSIPKKNTFRLSIYGSNPPTPNNILYKFGCDYRVDNLLKRMYYVNNHSYNFEKYQYLVGLNTTKDFQPLPLDYFDNIYDGFKNKGISTLPKTLLGCSRYDNVTANLCCLDCRWWPVMPEPKTIKWETIIQKFNLDTLNGLLKNTQCERNKS